MSWIEAVVRLYLPDSGDVRVGFVPNDESDPFTYVAWVQAPILSDPSEVKIRWIKKFALAQGGIRAKR